MTQCYPIIPVLDYALFYPPSAGVHGGGLDFRVVLRANAQGLHINGRKIRGHRLKVHYFREVLRKMWQSAALYQNAQKKTRAAQFLT